MNQEMKEAAALYMEEEARAMADKAAKMTKFKDSTKDAAARVIQKMYYVVSVSARTFRWPVDDVFITFVGNYVVALLLSSRHDIVVFLFMWCLYPVFGMFERRRPRYEQLGGHSGRCTSHLSGVTLPEQFQNNSTTTCFAVLIVLHRVALFLPIAHARLT